ncbi:TetR family transcriptional regulator [Streptomyces sp. NPDC055952]|uniref:TetR family transcriptional regulator n=1 Tax=Streptomyces sp. NPDC055952 TaxID=3345663 RepID=UPI0035E30111
MFHERGYEATSMSDIAARLGFTKAALYRHVDGKAQLLRDITQPARDDLRALLAASDSGAGAPLDRLAELLRGVAGAAADDPARHALLWRAGGEPGTSTPDAACRAAVIRRLTELLERAALSRDIRSDIDAGLTARLLLGACTGTGPPVSSSDIDVLLDGPLRRPTGTGG